MGRWHVFLFNCSLLKELSARFNLHIASQDKVADASTRLAYIFMGEVSQVAGKVKMLINNIKQSGTHSQSSGRILYTFFQCQGRIASIYTPALARVYLWGHSVRGWLIGAWSRFIKTSSCYVFVARYLHVTPDIPFYIVLASTLLRVACQAGEAVYMDPTPIYMYV